MKAGWFGAVRGSVTRSPGWVRKLALLALLELVPIIGPAGAYGYLYGWAGDLARDASAPLPARLFGDAGRHFARGFAIWLLNFALGAVGLALVGSISGALFGLGGAEGSLSPGVLFLLVLLGMGTSLIRSLLAFASALRITASGRASAGFELGAVWRLVRRDAWGLIRIFLMQLLAVLACAILLSGIACALVLAFADAAAARDASALALLSLSAGFLVRLIPGALVGSPLDALVDMLAACALGIGSAPLRRGGKATLRRAFRRVS